MKIGLSQSSIDVMAARGRRQTNSESLAKVKRELEVVPPEILDAICDNGTRLVIVNKGENPLTVEPTEGAPLIQDFEPKGYGPALRDGLTQVLTDVEQSVAKYDAVIPQFSGSQRALLEQQREDVLSATISQRSGGLVTLLPGKSPTTLEGIAKSRGASTPEEIAEFSELIETVSGEERMRRADAASGDPALTAVLRELPLSQRPVQGHLLIPTLRYIEHQGERLLTPDRVADWAQMTNNGEWAGYYRSDVNTVFLREEYLGETNEGTSTPVHEFGHAFGDLIMEKYPTIANEFRSAQNEAYLTLHQDSALRFPTNYSAVNPSEFVAETFAVRFDPDREQYPSDSKPWSEAFEGALDFVISSRVR